MATPTTLVRWLSDANTANTGGPTVQGGALAQLLPVFGGEVQTAYYMHTTFMGMVNSYTIESGIHMDFPAIWKVSSEIHDPGDELLGTDVESMSRRITLDDRPRAAHVRVDDIDEVLAHFTVRQQLSDGMGKELAEQNDHAVCRLLILASREARVGSFPGGGGTDNTSGGYSSGSVGFAQLVTNRADTGKAYTDTAFVKNDGTAKTSGHLGAILKGIQRTVVKWDLEDVPMADRFFVTDPETWHGLRTLSSDPTMEIVNTDVGNRSVGFMEQNGVNPDFTKGADVQQALLYKGVYILRSNNLPNANSSTDRFRPGDFRGTVGIMWQRDAVGFITKLGITTETERSVSKGQDLMVAKTLIGGGSLRPQVAVEFSVKTI